MNMQRKPGRMMSRHKPTKKEKLMVLEQTVKEVISGNGVAAETPTDSALLKEIVELKAKLEAALTQGAMDALKVRQLAAVEAERDELKQQIGKLTSTQPMAAVTAIATTRVECEIRHDVKAPELAKWRNDGWEIKHFQFVDNDRSVPSLAVVMERLAAPTLLVPNGTESISLKTDTPKNSESAPANEPVPPFTEIIIEEAEPVPLMTAKQTLMQKLSQDKPIFGAIAEYGVDAVIDAMDAQVYEKARAAYDAYAPADTPIRRFESTLLSAGDANMDRVNSDNLIIEGAEIIEVLS